jgi:predicted porin
MNKKLLAFAVAAAFAAPMVANADSGNVTIGGTLKVSVDNLNGKNAAGNDLTREWNIASNSSNIWFKGSEDLGNGLKAVWQLTTYVGMGSTSTSANNAWTNGNSFLGLAGGFGTVILGKHDTPFKILGRKLDLFGDQIGDSRNVMNGGALSGLGNAGKAGYDGSVGWDLRPDNVLAWITPTFSGFHAAIATVTDVALDTAGGQVGGSASDKSIDAWSALGIYENGPITVGLAWERHNLSNLAAINNESAWRLGGAYDFGAGKVNALWQKVEDGGGNSNNDRTSWGLGGSFKVGSGAAKLQYTRANDVSNTSDTGAAMWSLGYDHNLSKRTVAYAAYARTNNDDKAAFSAFGGGHGDNPGAVMGKNPSGFSLGLTHSF